MRFLPRIIGDLAGRSGQRFAAYLLGQTDAAIEGAQIVRRCVAGELSRDAAVDEMRLVEHRGDESRGELVRDLGSALVMPIDREDLFRVSRAIDDVLDVLRDFVRQWELFEMDRSTTIEPVAEVTCAALADLREAVAIVDAEPRMITTRARKAKTSGNEIRRTHDVQLAMLYRRTLSVDTLKERDLLRRLDVVGLRLATVANTLADAAVKRDES